MSLSEAREAFIRAERLAVKFPRNHACQVQRKIAYNDWIQSVRTAAVAHLSPSAQVDIQTGLGSRDGD